jgi:hypothetical protein
MKGIKYQMRLKIINSIKQYRGTSIGALFAVLSFISLFILIPPCLCVFFGGIIELISSAFIGSDPYHKLATFTINTHLVLFAVCNIFLVRSIKYNKITKKTLFIVYGIFYLINHSLINYLYWWYECDFCGYKDGQLFFRFFGIVPNTLASFIFLIQGILVDLYLMKFKKLK